MKNKILTLFFYLLVPLCVYAQKHDNIWVLGRGGGNQSPIDDEWGALLVDFSDPSQPSLIEKQEYDMNMAVSNASFCDSLGNLLFYTNGEKIYNKNHKLMQNGNNLVSVGNGLGYLVTQGSLILPFPNHSQRYFILAVEDSPTGAWGWKLFSHEIDLNEDNGLGKVIDKRHLLVADTMAWGKLAAVKHANGRDWWFVVPPYFSNKYIVGQLNPAGISVKIEMVGDSIREGLGQAFFTPDGAHYIKTEQTYLNQPATITIFDFDRCKGQLSHQRSHLVEPAEVDFGMGGAVSSDSRYLYAFFTEKVLQYDLTAADIFATETLVGQFDGFVSGLYGSYFLFAQSGPDGRIYDAGWTSSYHMHFVKFPRRQGMSCEFVNHGLNSPVNLSDAIPNHPNYRLGPLDGTPCDTLGFDNHPLCHWRWEQEDTLSPLQVTFTDLSSYEPATWHWDFGDGTASQDTSPVHTYLAEGTYTVCLVISNQYSSDTLCRVLHLGTSAVLSPELAAAVQVFPNPFQEHLSVALASVRLRGSVLRLHDQMGREVLRQVLEPGISGVNTAELPVGMYFWEVVAGGVRVKSGKVIKVSE